MVHVWIICLHERWNMATFKGECRWLFATWILCDANLFRFAETKINVKQKFKCAWERLGWWAHQNGLLFGVLLQGILHFWENSSVHKALFLPQSWFSRNGTSPRAVSFHDFLSKGNQDSSFTHDGSRGSCRFFVFEHHPKKVSKWRDVHHPWTSQTPAWHAAPVALHPLLDVIFKCAKLFPSLLKLSRMLWKLWGKTLDITLGR